MIDTDCGGIVWPLVALFVASSAMFTIVVRADLPSPAGIRLAEIAPDHYLLSENNRNAVLYTGRDMSMFVGVPRPSMIKASEELITRLRAGPVRYAALTEDDGSLTYMDGGFGHRGVITIAHESYNHRLREAASTDQRRHQTAGSRRLISTPGQIGIPTMSFSEVLQLWFADEEVHLIHQHVGFTNADVLVHFEGPGILYLGSAFTMNGYPSIDKSKGGNLNGMIDAAEYFIREFRGAPDRVEPIVPGRGPVATLEDLRQFHEMLVTIRRRVGEDIDRKRTLAEVIVNNPTVEFDARWGHGPVGSSQFIGMVFDSVTKYGAK
jgi:cyclase